MKILGIDIARGSIVACLIDDYCRNFDARELYYSLTFHHLKADAAGIKKLIELNPDVAVMEPTGVNYSKIWQHHLTKSGVKVYLVGHKELRAFRTHLDLPDKDDAADSLALALYLIENVGNLRRFVQIRDPKIAQLRELVLRLSHLTRIQSPIINRLRQDLEWQFPECANVGLNGNLFWGWLAGDRQNKRYDEKLLNSCGLGITDSARSHARLLVQLQRQERDLENQVTAILLDDRFNKYRQVFKKFGFGLRIEALILSQIYPIENYLLDGRPEVRERRGKYSAKLTKRHLSLRRFKKTLGVAPTREDSGSSKKTKKSGSALCRKAIWQWLFIRIEPRRSRINSEIGQRLAAQFDEEKKSKPIKLVRSRIAAKAVTLLFYELVKEGN